MLRVIALLFIPLVFGPLGYFLGRNFVRGENAADTSSSAKGAPHQKVEPVLYKMPLGGITFQVMRPRSIVHITIDLSLYIEGAKNFELLGSAQGKAMLRDAAISAVSDLAENSLWVDEGEKNTITPNRLALEITQKIYGKFPFIRSAKINKLNIHKTTRP